MDKAGEMIRALLGLNPDLGSTWVSQAEVAELFQVTRARVSQVVGRFQGRWSKEPGITRLRADLASILESSGGVMAVGELADTLLVARGSVEDEPLRNVLSLCALRAAFEVERSMDQPRYLLRRERDRVLIALNSELASFALKLGEVADRMAEEDPLIPPARAIEMLRDVEAPSRMAPLSDARLVRLAVASASRAALSSRQELYPRGMDAARALRLSQGALYSIPSREGVAAITVQEIRERVLSRYPEAEPLPDHPALGILLDELGFGFQWDSTAKGVGGYTIRARDAWSVSSASASRSRWPADPTTLDIEEITPEIADARQFEEKLRNGLKRGAFYALLASPRRYQEAYQQLSQRFPVELVDFEGLFLDALREVADKARVNWDLVIKTDAKPNQGDWDKLLLLVGRALPLVEARLLQARKPVLLIYAGLLARYDRMDVIERLRDQAGRRDGIPGLWLLIPGDHQAMLDGKVVPILGPGQRTRIPESWLGSRKRSSANGSTMPDGSPQH